jgi:hypothetical protein
MYGIHGAIGAATTAAHRRRQLALQELEETEMTNYTQTDLDQNWEFKIVRSASGVFRNPEIMQQVLAEESMAGWELLEKLDDSRMRLKRPRDARKRDDRLPTGADPYRTQYGTVGESRARALILSLVILLVLGVAAFTIYLSMAEGTAIAESGFDNSPIGPITMIFTTAIILVIIVTIKLRLSAVYPARRSPAMVAAVVIGVVLLAVGVLVFLLLGG